MRPSGYLPAMYVIQVLPFFALVLAGVAERLVAFLLRYRAHPVFSEQIVRMVLVGLVAAAAAFYVVPKWVSGDRVADTADPNAGYQQAATWVAAHVKDPAGKRIVVDDGLWLDMVHDGFHPGRGAIYFFKVDLDPSVKKALAKHGGWRAIDYIVSTPMIRQNTFDLPTVQAALDHSRVLVSFGTGANQIQIREINR
jgi:hypothetical protein